LLVTAFSVFPFWDSPRSGSQKFVSPHSRRQITREFLFPPSVGRFLAFPRTVSFPPHRRFPPLFVFFPSGIFLFSVLSPPLLSAMFPQPAGPPLGVRASWFFFNPGLTLFFFSLHCDAIFFLWCDCSCSGLFFFFAFI